MLSNMNQSLPFSFKYILSAINYIFKDSGEGNQIHDAPITGGSKTNGKYYHTSIIINPSSYICHLLSI